VQSVLNLTVVTICKVWEPGCSIRCSDEATGWMIGVRFPAEVRNFSIRYRVKSGSGAHPASYPMGTVFPFPWSKAAGA